MNKLKLSLLIITIFSVGFIAGLFSANRPLHIQPTSISMDFKPVVFGPPESITWDQSFNVKDYDWDVANR